jgi:hypothetical protein
MTADPMLRLVYFEALNALHEAGGELPADPEALADELMLPAEEIARCLPILSAIAERGGRGGLVVRDGRVTNARVAEDLAAEASYRAEQATFGRASVDARRSKAGSAQPQGRPKVSRRSSEGTLRVPSVHPEGVPNPPLPAPTPSPTPDPTPSPSNGSPPGPPASRVGTGGDGEEPVEAYAPGDLLPDGREVLDVDEAGRPTVVRRRVDGAAPQLTAEAREAVDRLVAFAAGKLGYRFDRAGRRRLRERLLGGETEAQIRAGYQAQIAALEAAEAGAGEPEAPPGELDDGEDDDPELEQALRLVGPPAVAAAPGGGGER